jgi:hypothetical protein
MCTARSQGWGEGIYSVSVMLEMLCHAVQSLAAKGTTIHVCILEVGPTYISSCCHIYMPKTEINLIEAPCMPSKQLPS